MLAGVDVVWGGGRICTLRFLVKSFHVYFRDRSGDIVGYVQLTVLPDRELALF